MTLLLSTSRLKALTGRLARMICLLAIVAVVASSIGPAASAAKPDQQSHSGVAAPATAQGAPESTEAANLLASILGSARRFVVFHGIEPGHPSQTWAYKKSYIWGDIGIGPGVRTKYSGGSTLIGDCYQQPGQGLGRGCADIKPDKSAPPHVPPTYQDMTVDLAAVVRDIRSAVSYVDSLAATATLNQIGGNSTIASVACGTLNVIRVAGNVTLGGSNVTIQGCATDYFIFDVDGQWASCGGRVLLSGGVPASNILWVFKRRLQNSGNGGWAGTAIFDTADGVSNAGDKLRCTDCALLVLNGKLSTVSDSTIRWNPFTTYDYGDAPTSFGTLYSGTNGAARHKTTSDLAGRTISPRLGGNWDGETDGQPNVPANGDDLSSAPDDEDGVPALPLINTLSCVVPLTVVATNTSGLPATVACWIDFNRNGSFTDPGERAFATAPSQPGAQTLGMTFSGFGIDTAGESFMRCRISTDAAAVANPVTPLPPAAPAPVAGNPAFPLQKSSYLLNDGWPDGEVEDYQVDIAAADPGFDWGDAPDADPGAGPDNYNTTISDNGPNHIIVPGCVFLGTAEPDLEFGTLQNPLADADDLTDLDDEDGVQALPAITTQSTSVQLNVAATNRTGFSSTLRCWIDFNRNGVFDDTGEASALATANANSGTVVYPLSFAGFQPPVAGASAIRCRIAYEQGEVANPVGTALSGEVEDFLVTIQ